MNRVQQILKDPDGVAFYGELLADLSLEEVTEIWRAVQDEKLRDWAWRMRNEGMPIEPGTRSRRSHKAPARGFVYLCRNNRNGLIKIGFSKQPKYREATLQSEEPELEFVHISPGTTSDERALHDRYAGSRKRGEWFTLTPEDLQAIIAENASV